MQVGDVITHAKDKQPNAKDKQLVLGIDTRRELMMLEDDSEEYVTMDVC